MSSETVRLALKLWPGAVSIGTHFGQAPMRDDSPRYRLFLERVLVRVRRSAACLQGISQYVSEHAAENGKASGSITDAHAYDLDNSIEPAIYKVAFTGADDAGRKDIARFEESPSSEADAPAKEEIEAAKLARDHSGLHKNVSFANEKAAEIARSVSTEEVRSVTDAVELAQACLQSARVTASRNVLLCASPLEFSAVDTWDVLFRRIGARALVLLLATSVVVDCTGLSAEVRQLAGAQPNRWSGPDGAKPAVLKCSVLHAKFRGLCLSRKHVLCVAARNLSKPKEESDGIECVSELCASMFHKGAHVKRRNGALSRAAQAYALRVVKAHACLPYRAILDRMCPDESVPARGILCSFIPDDILSMEESSAAQYTLENAFQPAPRVVRFVRAIVRRLCLRAMSPKDTAAVLAMVDVFVALRTGESLSLAETARGVSLPALWAAIAPGAGKARSPSEACARDALCRNLLEWIASSLVPDIIRAFFYVTEAGNRRAATVYIRQDVWQRMLSLSAPSIFPDTTAQKSDIKETAKNAPRGATVYSVRLVPRADGRLRPIMRRGKAPTENRVLRALHAVLDFCRRAVPQVLGSSVFSLDEAGDRLRAFARSARLSFSDENCPHGHLMNQDCDCSEPASNHVARNCSTANCSIITSESKTTLSLQQIKNTGRLHACTMDVKACFETIPHDVVVAAVERLVDAACAGVPGACFEITERRVHTQSSDGRFVSRVRRSARVVSKTVRMFDVPESEGEALKRTAGGGLDAPPRAATVSHAPARRTALEHMTRDDVVRAVRRHVCEAWVRDPRVRGGVYRLRTGVPQGAALSALLCGIAYGALDADATHYAPLLADGRAILLRYVDDMLFVARDPGAVRAFAAILSRGIPAYGVSVNALKASYSPGVHGEEDSASGANTVRWCGLLLELDTMQIHSDTLSTRTLSSVADALRVGSRCPLDSVQSMLRRHVLPRMLRVSLLSAIHGACRRDWRSAARVLYEAAVHAALRMHVYVSQARRRTFVPRALLQGRASGDRRPAVPPLVAAADDLAVFMRRIAERRLAADSAVLGDADCAADLAHVRAVISATGCVRSLVRRAFWRMMRAHPTAYARELSFLNRHIQDWEPYACEAVVSVGDTLANITWREP